MHSLTSSWSTYITMYRWPIASLTMLHLFPWPVRLSKAIIWGHTRLHTIIKGRLLLRREKREIPMWQLFYCPYCQFLKIKSHFSWHTILKLFKCRHPTHRPQRNKNCFYSGIWSFRIYFLCGVEYVVVSKNRVTLFRCYSIRVCHFAIYFLNLFSKFLIRLPGI